MYNGFDVTFEYCVHVCALFIIFVIVLYVTLYVLYFYGLFNILLSYWSAYRFTILYICTPVHMCMNVTNLNTNVCEWKIFLTELFPFLAVLKHYEYDVSCVTWFTLSSAFQ
jgi:hypothetical protein